MDSAVHQPVQGGDKGRARVQPPRAVVAAEGAPKEEVDGVRLGEAGDRHAPADGRDGGLRGRYDLDDAVFGRLDDEEARAEGQHRPRRRLAVRAEGLREGGGGEGVARRRREDAEGVGAALREMRPQGALVPPGIDDDPPDGDLGVDERVQFAVGVVAGADGDADVPGLRADDGPVPAPLAVRDGGEDARDAHKVEEQAAVRDVAPGDVPRLGEGASADDFEVGELEKADVHPLEGVEAPGHAHEVALGAGGRGREGDPARPLPAAQDEAVVVLDEDLPEIGRRRRREKGACGEWENRQGQKHVEGEAKHGMIPKFGHHGTGIRPESQQPGDCPIG